MPTTNQTANAPYDLSQIEDDVAALQGQVSNLEEVHYFLVNTAPQPPNTLSDRIQLYAASSGVPAYLDASGLQMGMQGAQPATFPVIAVTAASLTNIATATVPANDANVGAVYELEVNGSGTQAATTAVTLQFAVALGGNVMSTATLGANFMAAGTSFRWKCRARVICHTTGNTGTWSSEVEGIVSVSGTTLLTSGASSANATNSFINCEIASFTTVDTTASQTLALQCAWGSVTGSPTLTSRVAIFKRIA